jgi:hypothetical protein
MGLLSAITAGLGSLGKAIATPATEYIKGRNEIKKIKIKGKRLIILTKIRAEIAKAEAQGRNDLTYDLQALENQKTSWKDEFLTLVFTFPFMLSFLSPFVDAIFGTEITPQIRVAWETVAIAPDWYQWVMIGIVASVYGLRWLFRQSNPLSNKKAPAPKNEGQ